MSIRPAKSRVERRLPAVAARELAGQPSQSSTQAIFLPAMIVLLGVLLPGSLVFNQVSAQAYPEWPGSLVIAVYTGVRLAGFLVSGNQRLYGFTFVLYCYLFMGLAPLVQLSRGLFPSVAPWVHEELNGLAIALVMTGIVAFEIGQGLQRKRVARNWSGLVGDTAFVSEPVLSGARINERRLYVFIAASLALTLAFVLLVGSATFLQSRTQVFASIGEGVTNASLAALMRSAVVGSLLVAFAAAVSLTKIKRGTKRFGLIFVTVVLGLASQFITNVVNAPRYLALVVLVGMLAAFGIFRTRARTRISFGAALAGFLFIFPVLGGFRNSISFASFTGNLESVLLGGDYDSFAEINNSIAYVTKHGYSYGYQLLGDLFVWVPRSIWPTKPQSTSTLVAESMGYPFTNVSAPLWAELLVDFGLIGVVVGFVLVGALLGRLDDQLVKRQQSGVFTGIAGMVVPFYLLILLRGALLSTVPTLLVMLLCIAFVTGRSKPSRSLAAAGGAASMKSTLATNGRSR
jgi:oligosaccharide repeat unit polymerase